MPPRQTTIFWSQVEAERERQRAEWSDDHDNNHSWLEWIGIVTGQAGRILMVSERYWKRRNENPRVLVVGALFNELQQCAVRIAAVAEALWETIERRRDGEIEMERQRIATEQRIAEERRPMETADAVEA
jgi:hypothetical protein